ncbi:unnamed protein product [marine sediment metagenome]|uniref:Uncharacterized protein n=1 Tax=marine sediment metagenome TaxID=412755 RepID=X1BHS1_9ZZZZ
MAITTGLERANTYLILPTGDYASLVTNALSPALAEFRKDYHKYDRVRLIPESFDSISIEDLGNNKISVELEANIILKMFEFFELRVDTGSYIGFYDVMSVDTTSNKVILTVYNTFVDETITFFNQEHQHYEDALGWYICSYCRFTLQKLKECKVMVTSTQVGDGNIEAYSTNSIATFQKQLKNNGVDLMLKRYYPTGH